MELPEPRLAPLTAEQKTLVSEIRRRWIDPSDYEDQPLAIVVGEALAVIIDCLNRNSLPPEVINACTTLTSSYISLFIDQQMTMLVRVLGNKSVVEQVINHANGHSIVTRIFERIGTALRGDSVDISDILKEVDISDILKEEGFSA